MVLGLGGGAGGLHYTGGREGFITQGGGGAPRDGPNPDPTPTLAREAGVRGL